VSSDVQVLSSSSDLISGFKSISRPIVSEYWGQINSIRYSADALVLDTPLPDLSSDAAHVRRQRRNLKQTIESLSADIIAYLKGGGVVVVLCSHRGPKISEVEAEWEDTLHWLSGTFDFEYLVSDSPKPVISSTDIGPIKSYLEYVDTTQICLTKFATPFVPLARSSSEECKPAALLESYLDPSMTERDFTGEIVFLPRPRSFAPINVEIARHIIEIVDYFSPAATGPDQTSLLEFDSPNTSQEAYDEQLDPELEANCIPKLRRGEHSAAIASAGKVLGERVRDSDSEELGDLTSTDLMQQAFKREGGSFRWAEDDNEQRGVMFLYAGAMAAMRNPMSHRNPDPERDRFLDDLDATTAMRFIVFVDLLLKMLARYEGTGGEG
jgi:hypothetical protein